MEDVTKSAKHRLPQVYNIPPGCSFLSELAKAIVNGGVIEGYSPIDNPSTLSKATIYVPTRRAARILAAEFIQAMGSKSVLLPSIRTLGDSDEDEMFFQTSANSVTDIPEMIERLERLIELTNLVRAWTTQLSKATSEFYGDEELVIPASTADAISLAKHLADLIDQLETEEVSASAIAELMEEDYGEWWKLTIPFLKIVLEAWPEYLDARDRVNPAAARRLLLDARTKMMETNPPDGPVIAAGSTGSIPATARFLKAVAHSPNGAVILPGIDLHLTDEQWLPLIKTEDAAKSANVETHPQFSISQLISTIGILPNDVQNLCESEKHATDRERLVSLALMSAEDTGQWHHLASKISFEERANATANISLMTSQNEREEALSIAIAMREVLLDETATAALVTPDRNLARRVSGELKRFGVEINDSGGKPLRNTPAASYMLLCQEVFTSAITNDTPVDPLAFVSLVKHPLFCLGCKNEDAYRLGLLIENAVIRGPNQQIHPGKVEQAARAAQKFWKESKFKSRSVAAMSEVDWNELVKFRGRLDECVHQVFNVFQKDTVLLSELASALFVLMTLIGENDEETSLFELAEGGGEIVGFLNEVSSSDPALLTISASEFSSSLSVLLDERVIRNNGPTHPRLHILGPLEARLQTYDLTVLGSLNETVWPQVPRNDPFLNRPLKAGIGMSSPERRIGLSAHDFQQLLGCKKVVLSRSALVDDTPSIPSRWLQRFETVIGEEMTKEAQSRGQTYVEWARLLDKPTGPPTLSERPNPKPDVAARPKGLSVTDVETWIRDPYALYARKILSLQKLPDLVQGADPATKGTLYHAILHRFIDEKTNPVSPNALERLLEIFDQEIGALNLEADIKLLWRPRFEEVARLYLEWEQKRFASIRSSKTETDGAIFLCDNSFKLKARADRIDFLDNGEIAVLDYKTGTNPSKKEALTLSPQLTLEGAIAQAGGFDDGEPVSVQALEYVRLRSNKTLKVDNISKNTNEDIAKAKSDLEEHVLAYRDQQQGYISRYAVQTEANVDGDFDHLARVREWSLADEDQDGGDA